MIPVKIDDKYFNADKEVVDRMELIYHQMMAATKELEILKIKVLNMRDAQKDYFRTRDHQVLRKSKALEIELDDLLAGKKKPEEQPELFR